MTLPAHTPETLWAAKQYLLRYRAAVRLAEEQAKDPDLWRGAQTAPERYLQQALRALHAAIEGEP